MTDECDYCEGTGFIDGTCNCMDDVCCCAEPVPWPCDCQPVADPELQKVLSDALSKTPGQIAYEEDVRRCPEYHDGMKRPAWGKLHDVSKMSWERDPTPREFKHRKEKA